MFHRLFGILKVNGRNEEVGIIAIDQLKGV